jgi:hypothetical protein
MAMFTKLARRAAAKRTINALSTALLVLTTATLAAAQGNGSAGITQATAEVTSYFDPATKLIYAIGAVVGLVGAVKVFSKWNSGDQDTQKSAMSWFGSCIFLVIVATVLRAFFL